MAVNLHQWRCLQEPKSAAGSLRTAHSSVYLWRVVNTKYSLTKIKHILFEYIICGDIMWYMIYIDLCEHGYIYIYINQLFIHQKNANWTMSYVSSWLGAVFNMWLSHHACIYVYMYFFFFLINLYMCKGLKSMSMAPFCAPWLPRPPFRFEKATQWELVVASVASHGSTGLDRAVDGAQASWMIMDGYQDS